HAVSLASPGGGRSELYRRGFLPPTRLPAGRGGVSENGGQLHAGHRGAGGSPQDWPVPARPWRCRGGPGGVGAGDPAVSQIRRGPAGPHASRREARRRSLGGLTGRPRLSAILIFTP